VIHSVQYGRCVKFDRVVYAASCASLSEAVISLNPFHISAASVTEQIP